MAVNKSDLVEAERVLRGYPDSCLRKKILEEYLSAPTGPCDSGIVSGGETLSEQERTVDNFMQSAELSRLTLLIDSVNDFIGALSVEDALLLELRYFKSLSWKQVSGSLKISVQSCRCRRAPEILGRFSRIVLGR